jgi:hypothetical protein
MKSPRKLEDVAAAALSVPEHMLLFCIASDTDWQKAGITGATISAAGFLSDEFETEILLSKNALVFLHSLGHFLPPSLATAMEELASTPDAKAHNRYASF